MKLFFRVISLMSVLVLASPVFSDDLQVETLSSPRPLPTFSLQDHNGKAFGKTQLSGQWSMIFLGFTSCPDVCPMTLTHLEAVRADLSMRVTPEKIPNIIFLAVDPERDQEGLKAYTRHFHPDYIGLTGEVKQIDALVDGLGGYYDIRKRYEGETHYPVVHTSTVYVVNPAGELVAEISPPFTAHATGEYLAGIIRSADKVL